MSLSSEKIYKRKPSIIVRQQLLHVLLRKYIKKVYCGVVADKNNKSKLTDRQLLRQEYYNDIHECLLNYCQLNNNKVNAKLLKSVDQLTTLTSRRQFIESIKKKRGSSKKKSTAKSNVSSPTTAAATTRAATETTTIATSTTTTTIIASTTATTKKEEIDCAKLEVIGKNSRCSMTVTRSNDKNFAENEEIGWGNKVQVELKRELGASFGVCIVGGTVNISNDAQQISGIFIKNIIQSSPAELCKQIKVGDRILAVNGHDVRQATQEQAINLIKNAGCSIKLDIQSFDLSDVSNKTKMNKTVDENKEKPPYADKKSNDVQKSTTIISDGEESSDGDSEEEESLGKVVTKAGKEIDRKSAGNIKRPREEQKADEEPENEFGYTDKKIKKRYGNLGNIIRVKIVRTNNSIGIALAGHRNRNEMGCFIAGLNPKGAASSQNLQVGDEILEINGVVLHKMCHLNASVLIKGIPGATLEFIVLRKDTALETIAVKQVTNFPSAVAFEIENLHSCYKNVRTVSIQKIGPSLGIMIIEGKHSELGQGIFISDIQEGSNADKAGLLVGEMILAVNKDLLIDCNYDSAASLLKRAEGIVTLVVCNPNKKDDKKDDVNKTPNKSEKKDTEKEKAKDEPPADPTTASVAANKESIIEINAANKVLGLFVAGGKMLQPPVDGAYIVYIYPNGAAYLDKRLQLFDKIVEIEGKKITADMSYSDLKKLFKRRYLVVKLTVQRSDPSPAKEIDIEIAKKAGKEAGFNFIECQDQGVLVTDIVTGSPTAFDNRLLVGDMITSINGDNVRNASFVDCVLLMKSSQSRINLKVTRPVKK